MDIAEIIERAGGPKTISELSKGTEQPITVSGVQKWRQRGFIPQEHWDLIQSITGVSIVQLHRISKQRRSRAAA
jgi:hypothetical protein